MVGGFYRRDLFAAVVGQVRSAVVFVGYIRQVAVAVIRQRAPVAGVVCSCATILCPVHHLYRLKSYQYR